MRARTWIALPVLLAAFAGIAWAAANVAPKAGNQPDVNSDGNTEYTYEVKPNEGEHIKDVHLYAKGLKGTPGKGDNVPSGWTESKSDGEMTWQANKNGAEVGSGGMTIKITVPAGLKVKDMLLTWKTTADGGVGKESGINEGPRSGEPSLHGPCASIDVHPPPMFPVGSWSSVALDSTEGGAPYVLFAVSSSDGPDPYDNYDAFVGWANEHRVACEWGVTLQNSTGNLEIGGGSNSPRINVSSSSGGRGETFYLVAVVPYGTSHRIGSAYTPAHIAP